MIISGKLYLADFEGNNVASLGGVIIADKVGKTAYGTKTESYFGTLTNGNFWTITYNYTYDVYLIKNVAYNKYLKATDSDTTTLSSTLDSYCVWRLKVPSKYMNLTAFSV